uniref:Uncharacterized protein n=1 Tax=Euplotes harpa TaxID=151035 RepID=A0A7S3JIR9_9SPIT
MPYIGLDHISFLLSSLLDKLCKMCKLSQKTALVHYTSFQLSKFYMKFGQLDLDTSHELTATLGSCPLGNNDQLCKVQHLPRLRVLQLTYFQLDNQLLKK